MLAMSDFQITPRYNLYLVGFMGVGKSAVGRGVAKLLNYEFIDSDWAIEKTDGRAISKIFEEEGEAAFRAKERAFVEDGHPDEGCVVACGGGLVIPEGMRELLLSKGVVICLFASEETILERTSRNNRRPLLNVEDPADRIRNLLQARMPIYQQISAGIYTDNRSLPDVIQHVARVYESEYEARLRASQQN